METMNRLEKYSRCEIEIFRKFKLSSDENLQTFGHTIVIIQTQ